MPVALKDVKGLMIEKSNGILLTSGSDYVKRGRNEAIDEQGSRKIGLNRDRLYDIVWHFVDEPSECNIIVDDILSHEAQIIEVQP